MNHFEERCLFLALTNKSAWQQQVELVWRTATTMRIYVKCFLSVFSYLVLIKKSRNLNTFCLASQHVENSFRFKMCWDFSSTFWVIKNSSDGGWYHEAGLTKAHEVVPDTPEHLLAQWNLSLGHPLFNCKCVWDKFPQPSILEILGCFIFHVKVWIVSTCALFKALSLYFSFSFFFFFWLHVRSLFPNQGLNPGPWQWEHEVLIIGPPRKSLSFFIDCATFNL